MARLTDVSIRNLKPAPQRREISDRANGLHLILQPSGHRSFAVRTRIAGAPCKLTLGDWPGLSLLAARKTAAAMMHDIAEGRDPRKAKEDAAIRAAAAKRDTLAAIGEDYRRREGGKLRSVDQRASTLRRLIYPAIGDRPIGTIRRSEITALLDDIEDGRGARAAHAALSLLRRIMNWHAL